MRVIKMVKKIVEMSSWRFKRLTFGQIGMKLKSDATETSQGVHADVAICIFQKPAEKRVQSQLIQLLQAI